MKMRILSVLILTLVLSVSFAAVAFAIDQATIDAIIADAADGHIDGNWTLAEIQAALEWLQNSPYAQQYSDVEGVLESFIAEETGQGNLAYTGANLFVAFGAGIALIGSGLLLRRKFA
jgi:hypothetical protein